MFWESVLGGLSVLLFWETYVAAALFFAIIMIPSYLVLEWMEFSDAEEQGGAGCLFFAIILPIIKLTGVLVFVLHETASA